MVHAQPAEKGRAMRVEYQRRKLDIILYLNRMSHMRLITWERMEKKLDYDMRRPSYIATLSTPGGETRVVVISPGPPFAVGIFKPTGEIEEVVDESMVYAGLNDLWVTASYRAGDRPLPEEDRRFMDEMMKHKPWED